MRRSPHDPWWPARLVGMAVGIVAVGCGLTGAGWLFAHVTDPLFGAAR